MNIIKKHKLYIRDKKSQSLRRLDKAFPELYVRLLEYFLVEGGNKQYAEYNKDVKLWKEWRPIDYFLTDPDISVKFVKLFGKKPLTVSYDGSWRPLVTVNPIKDKIENDGK